MLVALVSIVFKIVKSVTYALPFFVTLPRVVHALVLHLEPVYTALDQTASFDTARKH